MTKSILVAALFAVGLVACGKNAAPAAPAPENKDAAAPAPENKDAAAPAAAPAEPAKK